MTVETAEHVIEVLGRVPLFQGLPRSDLERIAELVNPREVRAGEFLFREGDPGDKFFIVFDGAVEVLKERPLGDHDRLAVKRRGEAFGEMSLLNDAPRSVSVRAVEDTQLLTVSKLEFDELLGGESIAVRLLRGLARSLRALDVRFAAREAGGRDPLGEFGRLVLRGLEPRSAPSAEGFRLAGATVRDESLGGGSLWDGFTTDDGRTLLTLMDVKGAGLPPAYLIAITRALLREVSPKETAGTLLRRLNAATFDNLFEGLDECIEVALVQIQDGTLSWSCAGDQSAIILRDDGTTDDTPSHGPALGILPRFDYDVATLELQPGDTLLAFSEAPGGMVKGAIDLVRGRPDAEPGELASLLRKAIRKVLAESGETDVSFLVVSPAA